MADTEQVISEEVVEGLTDTLEVEAGSEEKSESISEEVVGEEADDLEKTAGGEEDIDETDAEIEALRLRVKDMEEEAAKIEAMQNTVEKSLKHEPKNSADVDSRSVYVGSVDYSTTKDELQEFFQSCGPVNRVTIIRDKWTGQPKGYAYVEFTDSDSIVNALILNETPFKGRALKISPKRTNVPGFHYGGGKGKGKGKGGKGRRYSSRRWRPRRSNYYSPY